MGEYKIVVMESPDGKQRKIYYIIEPLYGHAYVWVSPFKRINHYAEGIKAVNGLVEKLEKKGWKKL